MPAVTGYNPRMISAKNSEGIDHPGTVKPFNGLLTMIPAGWALMDGQELNRITDAALFAALGASAGSGNGSTTFNVPDARGVGLRGVNGTKVIANGPIDPDAASRTANRPGGNTGNNVNTVQSFQLQAHGHTFTAGGGSSGPRSAVSVDTNAEYQYPTSTVGGNETRGSNLATYFIIKR